MRAFLRQFLDPSASRQTRWKGAIMSALALTLVFRLIDDGMARRYSRDYGTTLAKQIASQAEGLALAAAEKNIQDPVGWALFHLGQGVEPRYMRIIRDKGVTAESLLSSRRGEVELRKTLNVPGREDSGGIRIVVTIPTTGFLGTTSDLARDFLTVLVAVFFSLLFGSILEKRSKDYQQQLMIEKRERIEEIIPELKDVLLGIGRQLRDIFVHFEALSGSSMEAHENISLARAHFHDSIQGARRVLKQADEISGHTLHAEASILNLMLEASRIAERTGSSPYPVHLIHQQLLEIRNRASHLQKEVRELERGLEPTTTDLDISFHALNDAQQALRAVPAEIQKTSEKMTEQARIFQRIREELTG